MSTRTPESGTTSNPNRVSRGVREGGQFATGARQEPKGSLSRGNRLAALTPVAVDTELADHYKQLRPLQVRLQEATDYLTDERVYREHMAAHPESTRYRFDRWKYKDADTKVPRIKASAEQLRAQIAAYRTENIDPLEAEYERRGRWSRFFLVTSSGGGHVHSSMSCSTCRPQTQFVWLVEEAGKNEDEIIDRAGDGACTACFPHAPVADRNRPRPNPFEDPEVKAAREARAEEKRLRDADRIAKGLFNATGEPVTDHESRPLKTERSAETYVLREMEYIGWYNRPIADTNAQLESMADIQVALIQKRGVEPSVIRDSWTKKIADKVKRDRMSEEQHAHMKAALEAVNRLVDERAEDAQL